MRDHLPRRVLHEHQQWLAHLIREWVDALAHATYGDRTFQQEMEKVAAAIEGSDRVNKER